MIFEETEDGLEIWIPHKEMMCEDIEGFIRTILAGRKMYRCHYADVDDDDSQKK